jgi:hypothetical protein
MHCAIGTIGNTDPANVALLRGPPTAVLSRQRGIPRLSVERDDAGLA